MLLVLEDPERVDEGTFLVVETDDGEDATGGAPVPLAPMSKAIGPGARG